MSWNQLVNIASGFPFSWTAFVSNATFFCHSRMASIPFENKIACKSKPGSVQDKQISLKLLFTLEEGFLLDDLDECDLQSIFLRFGLKGLGVQFFRKYNVKLSADKNSLLFPFDDLSKEFAALQTYVWANDLIDEKLISYATEKQKESLLFGWSLIGPNQRHLVVTSHPLDAIAINQETDISALSLSYEFKNFVPEVLYALKKFVKVIFWLHPSLHSCDNHKIIGHYLGKSAYYIRTTDSHCALKCLQNGLELRQILAEACPLYDEGLETYDSYTNIVKEELKGHEKNAGLKWKRFSALNELLKGHRKGELTIFSGQTGTGKTTFMSEYSLDLCMQGLPTLWASFEITNTRLMKTMLFQLSQCGLDDLLKAHDFWSKEFCKLRMFFLKFGGSRSLKKILKTMANAVLIYNIQHVVIDNLQFMMNMEEYGSSIDQFRRQDQIFSAFREFATKWNCHVTLVIHPRKEPEYSELNTNSIAGTAKASQEADNILILQTTKTRQYLQVTKNRFDGHKGCIILDFNRSNQTFSVKKISSKTKEDIR
ncbi:twinkle mtDNA helicase-like [Uloborus diversus]|uniref:twinkle mtDNA helicase-like n=1 Tax=Uloborus diversus TaxID=327109 RepID=UPI00240A4D8E|nr:twinkle mtDNA helicase-like [Uloborus diversus]